LIPLMACALLAAGSILVAQSTGGLRAQRHQMVERQIVARGIAQPEVLRAMRTVPRHLFVDAGLRDRAYEDQALPIGDAQAIPQPYLVALMTSLLELDGSQRVLEIGTGSGYQAAILSLLASEVFSIEIMEDLGREAARRLEEFGYDNVQVIIGDGYRGLAEEAPFDGILVTAAPDEIPQPLLDQLKVGGRMVIPVGGYFQDLLVLTRTADGIEESRVDLVRLEPMTGEAQKKPD
jgi:protein-L-isoaspartate(D-aspartate) O-methyltransferase